jgi:hypothetical protein
MNCKKSMMKKAALIFTVISCFWGSQAYSLSHQNYTLDVYHSNVLSAEEIDKQFSNELSKIADIISKVKSQSSSKEIDRLKEPLNKVMTGIQAMGEFPYLSISPIIYSGSNVINMTVDVVDKSDALRLQGFKPKPTDVVDDPNHLIESWLTYDKAGFEKFLQTKKAPKVTACNAFHCSYGFDDPSMKKYGIMFDRDVPKYKNELIAVLENDKDEAKRGAAAYLLAHLKDGNEVIKILVPSMRDPSSHVRNNAMRVLAQTMIKMNKSDFPVDEVIRALRYPSAVDRNKALYIITSLITQPRYAEYIKNHAVPDLLDELRLDQPNGHDIAYTILKSISHKKYGERDYAAWESWAKKNCAATG